MVLFEVLNKESETLINDIDISQDEIIDQYLSRYLDVLEAIQLNNPTEAITICEELVKEEMLQRRLVPVFQH